jgi:hypothetical protein
MLFSAARPEAVIEALFEMFEGLEARHFMAFWERMWGSLGVCRSSPLGVAPT